MEDGIVNASFNDKSFQINLDGKYFFINEKYNNKENENDIKLSIIKDKDINVESFFKTKKTKINSKEFVKYIEFDKKLIQDQDITLNSDNKISFSIDKKNKIKNLKLNSILNFDKLKIDYISNRIKKRIPNYNNQIFLTSDYLEID